MQMKHRLVFGVVYIVSVLAAAVGGLIIGFRQGGQAVRIENWTLYDAAMISYDNYPEARSIGLRDYLKARYYYSANNIPESWLGSPRDYGPVDFSWLPMGKGPTSPREEYRLFKARSVQLSDGGNESRRLRP